MGREALRVGVPNAHGHLETRLGGYHGLDCFLIPQTRHVLHGVVVVVVVVVVGCWLSVVFCLLFVVIVVVVVTVTVALYHVCLLIMLPEAVFGPVEHPFPQSSSQVAVTKILPKASDRCISHIQTLSKYFHKPQSFYYILREFLDLLKNPSKKNKTYSPKCLLEGLKIKIHLKQKTRNQTTSLSFQTKKALNTPKESKKDTLSKEISQTNKQL